MTKAVIPPVPRRFGEAIEVPGEAGDPAIEDNGNLAAKGEGRCVDDVYGYLGELGIALTYNFYYGLFLVDAAFF